MVVTQSCQWWQTWESASFSKGVQADTAADTLYSYSYCLAPWQPEPAGVLPLSRLTHTQCYVAARSSQPSS